MKTGQKKMSKFAKGAAGVAAAAVIAFAGFCVNEIAGNPVSKHLATKTAEEYLAETYPDLNLEMGKCYYDFKSMHYSITVTSLDSVDTRFSLDFDSKGNLREDNYGVFPEENTRLRFRKTVHDDLAPALEEEFKAESGKNSFVWIYLSSEDTEEVLANYFDVPVDLDNFPFEIGVQVAVYAGEKTDEKIKNIINRVDRVIDGKYIVDEYSIYFYPNGGGQPEYVEISGEELVSNP